MKRLWAILFVLPLFAQNQWGITEVQDPCNNQEYLILKKRVDTKGANDLMPIKNGVIDFEKYEFFRHYDKLCLEYKENPCGYSGYQTLKKKGVVNLTASEFETYKIFDSACLKQELARRRGAEYQYVEGNEWTGGKYQKSNTPSKVLQEPSQTENNQKSNFPLIISVNINGNHEWSYQNESINRDVDMGFSGALEGYLIKGGGFKIGFGVEYMLIRDVKNNGGGIKFKSTYGIVKISPGGISGNLYLKGKYGFNIFTGDANYSSGLQSVIYGGKTMYGLGGELYFSPNTFVELMAITNTGEVIVVGGTLDIKYTYFNVGLGFSF